MAVTLQWEKEIMGASLPEAFKDQLLELFRKHGNKVHSVSRISRKPVSIKTQYLRVKTITLAFVELRQNGYALQSPYSLHQKHVAFLVKLWVESGQLAGTIENKLTYLRTVSQWMGKHQVVLALHDYPGVPKEFRRVYIAEADKSWEANGVDPERVIDDVEGTCPHVAMTLRLCAAFRLRRKEASMLRPARVKDGYLPVLEGTKGGRPRQVRVEFEWQYKLLADACRLSHPERGSMIPPGYTPEQWHHHYYRVLRKHGVTKKVLGVTTHGLRHGSLQDLYTRISGVPAPIKGDEARPTPAGHQAAMEAVVREAGHSRISKANAYLSKFNHRPRSEQRRPTYKEVSAAIQAAEGNKKAAAASLSISRSALYRILEGGEK